MNRSLIGTLLCISWGVGPALVAQDSVPSSQQARVLQQPYVAIESGTARRLPVNTAADDRTATVGNRFPSLSPRSPSTETNEGWTATAEPFSGSLITVGSSLVVVLGLFAGLVWITRRVSGRSAQQGAIPSEVMQPLGSSALDARTTITLLRCGNRILVLARTQAGVQAISEITDPNEVRHLTALCQGNSKHEFASTLQAIEKEPTAEGYIGESAQRAAARPRGRLFATA